jgi:YHS domain-containing protein
MLKQFLIILFITAFVSVETMTQENPEENNEETQINTEVKMEKPEETMSNSEELKIWNKVCPVQGNAVEDDTPTVEYNGKLYGFCCPGCDTKFAKNPEKYSKNLNEDGTRFIGRK